MARFKTFEEFVLEYHKKGVIDKVATKLRPSKQLNDKQVRRYYEQYVRKWQRANDAVNGEHEQSADSKLSQYVRERDGRCRLLSVLTAEEYAEWKKHDGGAGRILDAAHVFGKGAYPWMRYDKKNVVLLNRFSHRCLDTGLSPVSARPISPMEKQAWWQRIVGIDWEYLIRKSLVRK